MAGNELHQVFTTSGGAKVDRWIDSRPKYEEVQCLPECKFEKTCDTARPDNCPKVIPYSVSLPAQGVLSQHFKARRKK